MTPTLTRLLEGLTLFVLTLATTPLIAGQIEQSGWIAAKQRVDLPNGTTLAYVETGDPRASRRPHVVGPAITKFLNR